MPTSIWGSIANVLLHIDPLAIFIFAVLFCVLGLVLDVVYKSKLNEDRKSKDWPSTSGQITLSRVEKRAGARSRNGSRSTVYLPVIRYSYTVSGTLYHSDRIGNAIYQAFSSYGANGWVKRYPAHATVTVYYNPENPTEAVLEPTSSSNIVGFVVGVFVSLLGVLMLSLWIYRLFNR